MIKRSYIVYFALLQLLALSGYAQELTVKEVLNKATNFYLSQNEYQIGMTFTMYQGFSGTNATESYNGAIERKGDFIKNSILNTTVYQFPKAKVVLDQDNKTLTYLKTESEYAQDTPLDLSVFLEYYKKSQLIDKGSEWICEMTSEQNNFNQLPYGKVVLHIDKKDYHITKQVLFFSKQIPFGGNNGEPVKQDYGRLMINLSHDMEAKVDEKKLEDFVTIISKNKIQLQKIFAAYTLIDQSEYNK